MVCFTMSIHKKPTGQRALGFNRLMGRNFVDRMTFFGWMPQESDHWLQQLGFAWKQLGFLKHQYIKGCDGS